MNVLSWLGKTIATMAFVCFLSIVTTLVVINLHTQYLLDSVGIQMDDAKLSLPKLLSQLTGQENMIEKEEPIESKPSGDALEVWQPLSDEVILSMEDFNQVKDQLSDEEKMTIFSIVMENIPFVEMQRLTEMIEEGITAEEMAEIEAIMGQFLNEGDYDELMKMIGRTYDSGL